MPDEPQAPSLTLGPTEGYRRLAHLHPLSESAALAGCRYCRVKLAGRGDLGRGRTE